MTLLSLKGQIFLRKYELRSCNDEQVDIVAHWTTDDDPFDNIACPTNVIQIGNCMTVLDFCSTLQDSTCIYEKFIINTELVSADREKLLKKTFHVVLL